MDRRSFLKKTGQALVGLTLAKAGRAWAAPAAQERPDVLFLIIEGTPPWRLGTWGNKFCKTPNIDRLAAGGVRFDLAQCMAPPCNPARTSLLTGLRPETTKTFSNGTDWRTILPNQLTMPEHFRNNGYEAIRCGKIFHGRFETEASWDRVIRQSEGLPAPTHKRRSLMGPDAETLRQLKTDKQAARQAGESTDFAEGGGGSPFLYGPSGQDDAEETDGMCAEQGVRVLGQERDKPLFLALGFSRPHLPFTCPDKYFTMYPPETIELPKNPPDEPKSRDQKRLTEQQWREAICAFYACLTFVDAQIGRVLETLEKSGRADKTIVVFMADHGFMLGEHFQWRKGQFYDEGATVPLVIKAPGVGKPGGVCKRPVEIVDIFPTLFDLCGMPQPKGIEAISMKPLLEQPDRPWKKGAITMRGGPEKRAIRTERYLYWEDKQQGDTLFDLQTDPGEFVNLIKDPKCKDTIAELHGLLEGGWKACLPPT